MILNIFLKKRFWSSYSILFMLAPCFLVFEKCFAQTNPKKEPQQSTTEIGGTSISSDKQIGPVLKPYVKYNDSLKIIESFDAKGKLLEVNWEKILQVKQKSNLDMPGLILDQNEPTLWGRRYKLNKDFKKAQNTLNDIGVKIPLENFEKSVQLGLTFEYFIENSAKPIAQYVVSCLSINLLDSISGSYLQQDPSAAVPAVFEKKFLFVYNTSGDVIAMLSTSLPIEPHYLFKLSADEQFVLIGTLYDIGEGQSESGDFILYDTKSHKTNILPAVTDDIKKYPGGVGYLCSTVFADSLFQLTYNNTEQGLRFMINPYKRILYFKFYQRPAFNSIYRSKGDISSPTNSIGELTNPLQYIQVSF